MVELLILTICTLIIVLVFQARAATRAQRRSRSLFSLLFDADRDIGR